MHAATRSWADMMLRSKLRRLIYQPEMVMATQVHRGSSWSEPMAHLSMGYASALGACTIGRDVGLFFNSSLIARFVQCHVTKTLKLTTES